MLGVGSSVYDIDGLRLVLVDKAQTKQTRGYWIRRDQAESDVNDLILSTKWAEVAWSVKGTYPTPRDVKEAFDNSRNRYMCLCAATELDTDENEFGVVSP